MCNNYLGLSDEEYLKIAKGIKLFYSEKISEEEFIKIINSTRAKYISTVLPNPQAYKLLKDAQRIKNGQYKPKEVIGFNIEFNSKKMCLHFDRETIEILAKNGDKESQKRLKELEKYEQRLLSHKQKNNNQAKK